MDAGNSELCLTWKPGILLGLQGLRGRLAL